MTTMTLDFMWPVPPHYELAMPATDYEVGEPEPAQVTMQNGRSQDGFLVRLDGAEKFLEFRTRRATTSVRIGFENLRFLRLTSAVTMKRLMLSDALSRVTTEATAQQKCIVHYHADSATEKDRAVDCPHRLG